MFGPRGDEAHQFGLGRVPNEPMVRLRALVAAITADLARPLDERVTRTLMDELEAARVFLAEADRG